MGADLPCVGSAEVTDPASIKAAAARVGEHLGGSGLNLLINNAGMAKWNSLDNETLEDMIQLYTTNTIGPLLLGQVRPSLPALQCSSGKHPFPWPWVPELGCPRGHEGPVGEGPGSAPVLRDSRSMRSSWSRGLELRSWSLVDWDSGKRREDAPVLVPMLPVVEGAGPVPVPPLCMAPSPLFSSQAFLPLLKKAAQGSPGSALSCSKAAIINMSSSAGSIEEVYLWNYGQVVSYRCSKVLPHCTRREPRHFPVRTISYVFQPPPQSTHLSALRLSSRQSLGPSNGTFPCLAPGPTSEGCAGMGPRLGWASAQG